MLTVYLSLAQPRIGNLRINHAWAALLGALLMLFLLPVSPREIISSSLDVLLKPIITIVSLMVITLLAERAGLFNFLLDSILRMADGNGRRLFFWLFVVGALAGSVFTNDAVVLILTPLVCVMSRNWIGLQPTPFLFAVLNIANLVGVFAISNPINIVVAGYFDIDFLEYTKWMLLPALAGAVSTYLVLRLIFKKELSKSDFRLEKRTEADENSKIFLRWCVSVLLITLLALFIGPAVGIPLWSVTAGGALTLLLLGRLMAGILPLSVVRNVAWDVILFVVGFFIIVNSLKAVGITTMIGNLIIHLAGTEPAMLILSSGFISAICSALMNNHPTAYIMALTIQQIAASPTAQKILAFAMLIGGDLGPKMLPIGSLAALLWFRILRDHGIHVPYSLYIKVGVPVTLVALIASLLALIGEVVLFGSFS